MKSKNGERFTWEGIVRELQRVNLDPRRLACGCAVKIDLRRVVYPALRQIRPRLEARGIRIAAREDADVVPCRGEPQIRRMIFSLGTTEPEIDMRGFNPDRAITLTSVYRAGDPHQLAEKWQDLYERMADQEVGFTVGKGHTIEAYSPDGEFILFDFINLGGGEPRGYLVANNDTIQLIDPTIPPEAPQQTAVALSNALNDLFILGAVDEIKVHPVYATPGELRGQIEENIRTYCESYDFELIAQEPVSDRTLLLGATVFARTMREPPLWYDKLEEGDLILVHRPFGDLAPINLYIQGLVMGEGYLKNLGFDPEDVRTAKEEAVRVMARPNLEVGRVINRYCPGYGEPFQAEKHIKATGDLSGPGIEIFNELAEKAKADIELWEVPLNHEAIVEAACEEYLLPNGTSGTNGAIAIVASERVVREVEEDLRRLGHDPQVIGRVKGPGGGNLHVPRETRNFLPFTGLREAGPQIDRR